MPQSHIVLTHTFIDQDRLTRILATRFSDKEKKLFDLKTHDPKQNLANAWQKLQAEGRALQPELAEKKDFTESLLGFYEVYPQPTLLFLGNLSKYSLPMQEGMLKLLEEPPTNLSVILYAHDRSEILPTISSRCQFHQLSNNFVMQNLDESLLEKTKKKLPPVRDWLKLMIVGNSLELPDLKNVEREEIDFWLWQLQAYAEEYYRKEPQGTLAKILDKILHSRKLNRQNLQKKFVLGWLS